MSNRLMELRQRQHDLKTEATALLDAADKDDRDLTEEETSRYSTIEKDLEATATEIESEEEKIARRRKLDAVRTAPPPAGRNEVREPEAAKDKTNGFGSVAEFANAVRVACTPESRHIVDPRLSGRNGVQAAPSNYMEGAGSSGEGFELPVQYRDEIWQLVFQMDGLLNTVDLEPTSARQVDWVADETTPWGSTGIQAYWRAESAQMSASKALTKGRSMDLHELYAFIIATEELLEDGPRLQNRLTVKAAQAINWKIDDAIVNGTGSGQPQGWLNSSCAVTVAKETSQAADSLDDQNILKMYSRLLVAPGDSPFWLANRDTVPQLAAMTIGDQPVWMPPGALISAPGGILLGYPVRFSEHAQTVGDKGDLQLVSPRGYYAARRTQGVQFASSMHLYFDYNMQAFRWTFRFGGQPHLSAAVSPANGSNTRSHFVNLAARA